MTRAGRVDRPPRGLEPTIELRWVKSPAGSWVEQLFAGSYGLAVWVRLPVVTLEEAGEAFKAEDYE
jgi:hypothetical protein